MRILLVTRHYPPAVSGGARRPFLLTRALRDLGAEVFVVAPSLPEGERGLAVAHANRDPATTAPGRHTLRDHARELLLWPDPDIRWADRATRVARATAPWKPDWVWTTSPPESVHAAGATLKRAFGARWLADFRDHWLDRPHRRERAAPFRRAGEAAIARRWLGRADLVTCVDEHVARELKALGARSPEVLHHFSPTESAALPVDLAASDINVVHTGSISLSDPDARISDLLRPFEAAVAQNRALTLHLVGRLTDPERGAVSASPARDRIVDHGVQSFERALGFQRAADALILVGSTKTRVPPSKIVEYQATEAPIIACGDGDWRRDPRLAPGDPAEALAALRKGARRAPAPRPLTATEAAARLIELMRASG